jgi:hypothetical protein
MAAATPDLGLLAVTFRRRQGEVQAIPHLTFLGNGLKQQARATFGWRDLAGRVHQMRREHDHLVVILVRDLPAEDFSPPAAQGNCVMTVNDRSVPAQAHGRIRYQRA